MRAASGRARPGKRARPRPGGGLVSGLRAVSTTAVVDDNGEIAPACPACAELATELRKAQAESRSWHRRYENLRRDREREAAEHALWPTALALFKEWRILCHHERCGWDAQRFELVLPMLKRDGPDPCRQAIAGAWFDAWLTPPRRNGSRRRVDEWHKIFESRDRYEDFANRAPRNWRALFADERTLRRHAAMRHGQREVDAAPVEAPPVGLFAESA